LEGGIVKNTTFSKPEIVASPIKTEQNPKTPELKS
jgi:hypothetical protein